MRPLGVCAACGVVPVGGFDFQSSRRVTIRDAYGVCTKCNREARLLDGTFDFVDDVVRILSGPAFSHRALARVQEIAQAAQANNESPEAAVERISKIYPAFAKFKGVATKGLIKVVEYTAAAIIGVFVTNAMNGKPTPPPSTMSPQELQQIVASGVKEALRQAQPQPQPSPPQRAPWI